MPSQTKYIFEAALAILLILITVKSMCFFSSVDLMTNPDQITMESEPTTSTSSVNREGKILFMNNCAACHSLTKRITGPALAGVESRVPDRKLLFAWIRNNQQVLKSGNVYFNELYKEYNKTPMSLFPQLTDSEIESILDYISK